MDIKLNKEQRLIGLIKKITDEKLIGDDCAVLPGERLVSSDMLLEGKHFLLPQMSMDDLGWKAMAVNLSDIAAMGGIADFAFVNIGMPESISEHDFEVLYSSMQRCASKYGCRIVGGDLTASPVLVISITVIGAGAGLLRSDARAGDFVIVTGDFGASALALELILRGIPADASASYVMKRHLRPEPKLKEGKILVSLCANQKAALMDASDGLADALLQIADLSKVAIDIDAEKIPIHHETLELAVAVHLDPLQLALYGGEDYELVACVSETVWADLQEKTSAFKSIGRVREGGNVSISFQGKNSLKLDFDRTFQHWKH